MFTVARLMPQLGNGDIRPLEVSETPESTEIKFGKIHFVGQGTPHKNGLRAWGSGCGVVVKLSGGILF